MDRKANQSTNVVTVEEIRAGLSSTRTLAQDEEKALRMLHGVAVSPNAPLGRVAKEGTELGDELMLIEMQLMRAMRQREDRVPARMAVASPMKSKIVRALRKKK